MLRLFLNVGVVFWISLLFMDNYSIKQLKNIPGIMFTITEK